MAEESEGTGKHKQAVTIDLADLYAFNPDDLIADIKTSAYSNLAYV